ncbi:MAG: DNA translocase FtsK 4TM domain-containing protein, partial [Opitutaceae bacterium]|nr:DNA translocase FtsK 4TM domain-containing protein [Opitutaceae bacterium]
MSAKPDNNNKNAAPSPFATPRRARHWGVFFACLLVGVLLTVALFDYSPVQVNSTDHAPSNLVGAIGAGGSSLFFTHIGLFTWLVPVFLFRMAWVSVRNARLLAVTRFVAMVFCIVAGCGIGDMLGHKPAGNNAYFPHGWGGALGMMVYTQGIKGSLGVFGSGLLFCVLYAVSFTFVFTKDIVAEFEKVLAALAAWRERRRAAAAERAEIKRLAKEAAAAERAAKKAAEADARQKPVIIKSGKPGAFPDPKNPDNTNSPAPAAAKINRGPASPDGPAIVKPEETKKAKTPAAPHVEENYQFPPLALLTDHSSAITGDSDDEYKNNMDALVRVLGEFGVTVSAGEIHVGPVITCYEVVPAPGVRVEKIANLDKNIALNLRAQSVRILAPIPGKAAVGI